MWKCYTYRKKKNQNKNSLCFSPAAWDEALWDATSFTSSQEPLTAARAGVTAGFACQAAAWGSKPSAAAKSISSSTCLPRHPCPDGPTAAPGCSHTRLASSDVGGGLSPSIPHQWEVIALSENRDYNLKLMAVNMKSTWKITDSEPVSNTCKITNSVGEKGVERRKIKQTYILA